MTKLTRDTIAYVRIVKAILRESRAVFMYEAVARQTAPSAAYDLIDRLYVKRNQLKQKFADRHFPHLETPRARAYAWFMHVWPEIERQVD